ncbi:MAG TPA: tetratricopeptide repeat protein [Vicinamibacterales bacterium]
MRVRTNAVWVGSCLTMAALAMSGCSQFATLQARKAFKEANALYAQQEYRKAADKYEETITAAPDDPSLATAYFFLGNSYDNLYRPARKGEAANDELLTKAIDNYKLAAEKIPSEPDELRKYRTLALQYLVSAYGSDKLNDPSQAEPVLLKMIELDPKDPSSYFYLGKLYEDSGSYDQAEATFLKAREVRPDDSAVYMQLAGYYNRQGEFEKTMEALHQRAAKEPDNPEAHYYIANYYWDKVFRDFRLREAEKRDYIGKGLDAVDKAIQLNPNYIEAITYRGLLLRLEANLEKSAERQKALLREAEELQQRARDLQKKRTAGVS